MRNIYDLHRIMAANKLILVYEGEFTQEITKSVLAMAEKNLDSIGEESSIKRKVFNVMVECLQNILKHSDENKEVLTKEASTDAVFVIGKSGDTYEIISGNYIENQNIEGLKSKLDQVNNLDADGLKELYKHVMKAGKLSDKGGAGLGFIDMARKSGNKLEYGFYEESDKYSFFTLKTKISRNK